MMPVYYKYTNLFKIDQLKDYKIRISSPFTLNDPFESLLNLDVEQQLAINAKPEDFGIGHFKIKLSQERMRSIIARRVKGLIDEYGIVSLSETPRNLLMWAHYANEHRGVCIGFKPDLFHSQGHHVTTHNKAESYLPLKVNYDSCRPKNTDDCDNFETKNEIHTQIRNQLLTKSNDWMYEKEHRCILPLSWADEVKLLDQNINPELISACEKIGIIKKSDINTYYGDGLSTLSQALLFEKDAVFLKKVPPSSIVSIHLGCYMSESYKEWIINEVCTSGSELNHVKLFDSSPSPYNFELDFKMLHSPKRTQI